MTLQISLFMRATVALNFLVDETTKRYSIGLIYYLGRTLYLKFDTLSERYDSGAVNMVDAPRAYVPSITLIPV